MREISERVAPSVTDIYDNLVLEQWRLVLVLILCKCVMSVNCRVQFHCK